MKLDGCDGSSREDDAKLTEWMRDRLEIAVWATDGAQPLHLLETEVLTTWNPAITIDGVQHRGERCSRRRAR